MSPNNKHTNPHIQSFFNFAEMEPSASIQFLTGPEGRELGGGVEYKSYLPVYIFVVPSPSDPNTFSQ